ncbi:sugar transferase [Alkalicoccus chagannorensis]|uniref:sugar transferase n=1 Tax=Alkalicoccus chagannorensis TaxID=427072 RepID=UPI00040B9452|nr:sugar transferase [Alkalicoccus chagannorensis]
MKRLLDVVVSAVLLVLFLPLLAGTAIVIRLRLGGPVLFTQVRPGLHETPFTLYKFRTMTDARGPDGELLPDEQRLPPVGRKIRSLSLDELPQLWNVLRGDLSLVGPRPLLMAYLPLYTEDQRRRHLVRPGITGPAQVSGRNNLSWEETFRLDTAYVDRHSVAGDLWILVRTAAKVLQRQDVQQQGEATRRPFTGSGSASS